MRKAIRVAAVVAIVLTVVAAPRIWDRVQLATGWDLPERDGAPMLIVAHRGDLERFPEDTAEAIWAAAQAGADGIEFDVHRSASGTWFVIHDPTLDRTTDGTGVIARLPDDAIEQATIDAGFGFDPAIHHGIHVPRLEAVLSGLSDYPGLVILDLQHTVSGDAGELVELTSGLEVTVICRTLSDAAAVKRVDPQVETLIRPGAPESPNIDGWLMEAVFEATPSAVAASALPVTTYIEESDFSQDEYPLLRRAWAIGVAAFLTKHLDTALATRDAFAR